MTKQDNLLAEYFILEKRYEKLVLRGKEIKKEYDENIKYYVDNYISDPEWMGYLETTTSNFISASARLKIGKNKMNQIRMMLKINDC